MPTKAPGAQPAPMYIVSKLDQPAADRPRATGHHKSKPKMPPLPQGLLDGMTTLEVEHFWYFIESYQSDYPQMKPTDIICLYQAALEYINTLRVQAKQLASGEVISMARQHPGVQMRAWLDMMDVTRKARTRGKKADDDSEEVAEVKRALKAMSSTA